MRTTLTKINIIAFLFSTSLISARANDEVLTLSSRDTHVSIKISNQHIIASDSKKPLNYRVSKGVLGHLAKAYDARMIADRSDKNDLLFVVLSREPSRPNSMGRGYCGAGHEEYLLLIEVSAGRIELRDQILLQSCLKSVSMLIEHGDDLDDAANGLTANKDGSFNYRLLTDDANQERNISINARRFKVSLVSTEVQPASK